MAKSEYAVSALLSIMETLEEGQGELGVRGIAEKCGISKSAVQRTLQALCADGWVYQDEDGKNYHIGLRFLCFAREWRQNLKLVRQCDPIARSLMTECGQTVAINILSKTKAVCIHKLEPSRAVRIASRIGQEYPLHGGATGKLILAFAKPSLVEEVLSKPLKRFTPFTVTEPKELLRQLELIRQQMHCITVEELDPGVAAVAAPLLDKNGNFILGITIAGTRFDYERDGMKWLSSIQKGAKALSELIAKMV